MSETAVTDRPTFAQAFSAPEPSATASVPVTAPASETPAAPSSADAIAPPAETPSGDVTPTPGPLPFERHKSILDGAYKERDTFKAQLEQLQQQVGWASSVDRTAVEQAAKLGQLYQQDRVGYLRQILSEAAADPELMPLVRSEAARVLGSRPPGPASIEPDIPVFDDAGHQVAHAYSAERVKQLIAQSVAEAIGKEVGPIKQDFQTRQQQEQAATEQRQMLAAVEDTFATAKQELPLFWEHREEIAKVFETMPGDPSTALHRAWAKVVLPKLDASSQAKALDALKTKSTASISAPGSAVASSGTRPTSFHDPTLSWK